VDARTTSGPQIAVTVQIAVGWWTARASLSSARMRVWFAMNSVSAIGSHLGHGCLPDIGGGRDGEVGDHRGVLGHSLTQDHRHAPE